MSQHSINRAAIDALLPPDGWNPAQDLGYDQFLEGLANSFTDIKSFLQSLAVVRDPLLTQFLADLEREYGVITKETLTEEERREQLAALVYKSESNGSKTNLQTALQNAGFNVQVHENSPAVDPAIFLNENFQITVGDPDNGYVGDPEAYLGRYNNLSRVPIQYPIPTDPDTWPLIFFVGGDATRDGSGALTNIEQGFIPANRIEEFENIILSVKPLHTWAGMIITYT